MPKTQNKPKILFISSVRDDKKVKVTSIDLDGKVKYKVLGQTDLSNGLKSERFEKADLIFDTRKDSPISLPENLSLIVNQISDPNSHRIGLYKLHILSKMSQGNYPLINPPENVMLTVRDKLFQRIPEISGLCVPRSIRVKPLSPEHILKEITQAGLSLPLLLEPCISDEKSPRLFLEAASLQESLLSVALDGREYYLTEPAPFQGQRSKFIYRVYVIEGQVYSGDICPLDPMPDSEHNSPLPKDLSSRLETILSPLIKCVKLDYFYLDLMPLSDDTFYLDQLSAHLPLYREINPEIGSEETKQKINKAMIEMIIGRVSQTAAQESDE